MKLICMRTNKGEVKKGSRLNKTDAQINTFMPTVHHNLFVWMLDTFDNNLGIKYRIKMYLEFLAGFSSTLLFQDIFKTFFDQENISKSVWLFGLQATHI